MAFGVPGTLFASQPVIVSPGSLDRLSADFPHMGHDTVAISIDRCVADVAGGTDRCIANDSSPSWLDSGTDDGTDWLPNWPLAESG